MGRGAAKKQVEFPGSLRERTDDAANQPRFSKGDPQPAASKICGRTVISGESGVAFLRSSLKLQERYMQHVVTLYIVPNSGDLFALQAFFTPNPPKD